MPVVSTDALYTRKKKFSFPAEIRRKCKLGSSEPSLSQTIVNHGQNNELT